MIGILTKLLDANEREIERLRKVVEKINQYEPQMKKIKNEDFARMTSSFKNRLAEGESLDQILPEAFALVREAAWRTIGLRHFDVQLMAAIALFEGKVAEQKTGEGKTLSAVPALYLHALTGRGAHLVTVNDYLAQRDAGWNGPIFHLLGLSTSSIIQEGKSFIFDPEFVDRSHEDERLVHLRPVSRKEAYQADVTYGTNNEFGFDYLRDNMVADIEEMVQRGHYFAIVDEVDSVLIDEARTPLIISSPDTSPTDKYYKFASLVEKLSKDTDFTVDEKTRTANLTEHGILKVEKMLGVSNLYEKDFDTIHHIENALRARTLFLRDRDYVVKDGQIIIVDEFTGRLMFGRRWSDGLHQAVEAKENVKIQQESKTLATISFQNYFRMYERLSGMTGTAATEAEEFHKIYKLDVVVVPTHKPMIRQDFDDVIYKTLRAKYAAITREIEECYKIGRPVLVGTTSIEKNEIISEFLKRKKIPHNVLNAKQHEKEAMIISQAGRKGAVTVATNMAGRGVDIILGGMQPNKPSDMTNEEYQKSKEFKIWMEEHNEIVRLGGLHVIGTERHEARRIDNQLRGRAGRQGDPGSSRFFLSLEDDLMRIFGGEQISSIMTKLSIPEDQPIENRLISRAIEQAQIKVEGFHFDARKRVVEYDDVANQQREIVYKKRREIIEGRPLKDEILEKLEKEIENIVSLWEVGRDESSDYEKILIQFMEIVPFDDSSQKRLLEEIKKLGDKEKIEEFLKKIVKDLYESREKQMGSDLMRQIERFTYLSAIDRLWIEHLDAMDDLREGIELRGYGQRDPLVEYKQEAFNAFETLMASIDSQVARQIFRIQVNVPLQAVPTRIETNIDRSDMTGLMQTPLTKAALDVQTRGGKSQSQKIGRNDPCWCGSGKKWKKCHYPDSGPN